MKKLTIAILFFSSYARAACPQLQCPAPTYPFQDGSGWCRTYARSDFKDANGRFCDMCSPNAGICILPNNETCVNDCRSCKDSVGNPWFQDNIYQCVTTSEKYPDLCKYCTGGVLQAVSCDPFYCGAIDAIHCRVRDCFTCP